MGSSSSKSVSGNEYKSSNGTVTSPARTQTSLYGWGRIKHPFKPKNSKTDESPTGKGKPKKAKHNGFQVNEIRMPPTATTPVSSPTGVNGAADHTPATPTEIKENGNHETTYVDNTDAAAFETPPVTPVAAPNTTPFRKQVLSTPSFYGHYRCPGCSKYWRSGHSKEGCAQNCSKCGTPTIPRR